MKKSILLTSIIFVVIVISFFLYRSVTMADRENHIFCEQLETGMSKDEALYVLQQFGNIDYNISDFGSGVFEIYVGYVDPQIVGQKTYILSFNNSKYSGASAIASFWEGIDRVNAVCEP